MEKNKINENLMCNIHVSNWYHDDKFVMAGYTPQTSVICVHYQLADSTNYSFIDRQYSYRHKWSD